jgi:methylmalonyl-CoA decarboxylase subunit alpha
MSSMQSNPQTQMVERQASIHELRLRALAGGKPAVGPEASSRMPVRDVPSLTHATNALHARRTAIRLVEPSHAQRGEHRRLTARERLELLFDDDTFVEIDAMARRRTSAFGMDDRRPHSDGVITGWGKVDGRKVFAFAHDARILGGALGEMFATKIHKVMDLALATGAPFVGLNEGGGARIQEGVAALAGFGGIFARNVRASGVIPQISAILGSCAGGSVYSPALTDFIFVVRDTARMYITGPDVVAAVTGERFSHDELGGALVHATKSGVATFLSEDEAQCIDGIRHLLSFLPANNLEDPPWRATGDSPDRLCPELLELVPTSPRQAYDIRAVIEEIVDDGDFLEVQDLWACNMVCGLARLDGHVIGIVANQPNVLAGALDIDAAEKAARFVRTCDTFNIPLITLVDVPGFLPGADQEHSGIIRRGAKLLHAYCEATVPRIQLVLRKAYGGAYIVMDSRSIGADLSFAWPSNEIAVMGAEGAVNIINRREIAAAENPAVKRQELIADYTKRMLDPYVAAELGLVDDVIDPTRTRTILIQALEALRTKRAVLPQRKHGNGPQ